MKGGLLMVSVPFLGGCACGAIRYECTAPPLYMGNCHCRDCQRETGSAFAPTIGVAATALAITQGEPKYHTVTADSGNPVRRGFYPEWFRGRCREIGVRGVLELQE
jgi:hypothetical protein